jgi:hypothetical protein
MSVYILLGLAASSIAAACTCIPQGPKTDSTRASLVFRGTVQTVKEIPARPESARRRYAVTFTPSEYWTGTVDEQVTLHVLEPGTDCVGDSFAQGKEYIVFAVAQEARDFKWNDQFWFGWLDVLPAGTTILTGLGACNSTSEVALAAKTLKTLGKGKKLTR